MINWTDSAVRRAVACPLDSKAFNLSGAAPDAASWIRVSGQPLMMMMMMMIQED
jgi:hypothetical protein